MMTVLLLGFGPEWFVIIAALFLLFGASKLPQLAKAIGQSKKAFNEGLREADAEEEVAETTKMKQNLPAKPIVSELSDEALLAEMRRRAEAKQIN
ncbi:MAG: twin-arginine translocase TatA/TatE family subunit [Pyrinomonadaceae bacterium]